MNVDIAGTLKYINLSSMIWLNRKLIEKFLTRLLTKRSPDLNIYGIYYNDEFSNNDEQDSDDDYDYEDSNSNSNSNSDSTQTQMMKRKDNVQLFTSRIWLLISLILECIRAYHGLKK